MRPRRVFIAGATGATGQKVVPLALTQGLDVLAQVRPKPGRVADARTAVFALSDRGALVEALRGCTTILQLVGTVRRRFATGDTYESSDIGTTRALVDAGQEAGIDHLVLLSSAGAGYPVGAYLRAKAAAEQLVQHSGIPWTVFRPSAFVSETHHPPPGFAAFTRAFGLQRFQPIPLTSLAFGLVRSAKERAPLGEVLEGAELFSWVSPASR
jgi:uncharacterized protein YbjT (DUF2867 family)